MSEEKNDALPLKYRPAYLDEVIGNAATIASIESILKKDKSKIPKAWLFVGQPGCVDKDTEYLTKTGWKKFNKYNGEDIMQWDFQTQKAEFVKPLKYIKQKSIKLTKFKTKYGINQCLSDNHKVLTFRCGNWITESFDTVYKNHQRLVNGLNGKFLTSIDPILHSKIKLTDAELRVQVMFNADGTQDPGRKKGGVNLKRKSKIKRARILLQQANINFAEYKKMNGYTVFSFISPLRTKIYKSFWGCSLKQLKIITSEILFWDGDRKKVFSTMSKICADFIQYAFSCTGKRATIVTHETGLYRVLISTNILVGLGKKTKMESITPIDGYEYCFTVPSAYLVLRRGDRIFVTGNCGKTTLARIVRDELGCDPMSYREYNGSNTRKIADIRKLQENIILYPRIGDIKIYLIDEAHRLTPEAQDALLKMLEDPPAFAYIMLATTNPEKLIAAIHSRCTIVKVNPLPSKEIKELVRWTLTEELGEKEAEQFPEDVVKAIARNSGGACRDALKLLDMIIDMEDFDDMLDVIDMGVPQEGDLKELCNLLKTPRTTWADMAKFLRNFTEDPESIRRAILNWYTTMLLNDGARRTRLILVAFSESNYYDSGKAGLVGTCYDIVHMK